jgi:glycopeptide antibiotics resistance protein
MASGWGYLGGVVVGVLVLVDAVRQRPGARTIIVRLIAVAHVAIVIELALFPLPVDGPLIAELRSRSAGGGLSSVNLVPWATIGPSLHRLFALRLDTPEVRNLLGNLVMLMPLAWYGPILWPRLRSLLLFVVVAVAFSVSIELLQLAITVGLGYDHATDVDDVIVNTTGGILAFVVLWPLRRRAAPSRASPAISSA